jgi:hypothetical protein
MSPDRNDPGYLPVCCITWSFFPSDLGKHNSVGVSGGPVGQVLTDATPGLDLALGAGCVRGSAGNHQAVCGRERESLPYVENRRDAGDNEK